MLFTEILQKIRGYYENADTDKLLSIFNYSADKYASTSKNISFAIEVINILLMFKPDEDSIAAVMLYPLYRDQIIDDNEVKRICDQRVLEVLIGLKKIHALDYAENDRRSQVDILRKLFLAMAKDIRVVLISLSQRLYLMKHLEEKSEEERIFFSRETLDVYVPIADRLGVYRMKTKLEDLSFKYTCPKEYESILEQLEAYGASGKEEINKIKIFLEEFLSSKGINANVFGRIKSVYSIYRKLERKGLSTVDQLYDIFAMRIIVDSYYGEDGEENVEHLYNILGLIHSEWKPLSRRFKDYVSIPKTNGYRSLHTVVLGITENDKERPVEIQIRTQDMHTEAEYGIASHWLYKKVGSNSFNVAMKSQVDWLKGLSQVHMPLAAESNLLKEVELNIFEDRIFVLTPRGEVKDLPVGSCPIDFAYYIHTDVGHQCYMAKVDDKIVPLDYELKNGDMVRIFTRKDSYPKLEWLSQVKTGLARNKIKNYFNALNSQEHLREGRRMLNSQLKNIGKPVLDQHYSILKNMHGVTLNKSEREQILEEVGKGAKLVGDIIKQVYPREKALNSLEKSSSGLKLPHLDILNLESQILVGGEDNLPLKIAKCCSPRIADNIVAYVTRGNRITIHKKGCQLLSSLNEIRMLDASWKHVRRVPANK
ncbi:HD domain-containing protein [Candidatus Peregrinibacteria bacterium]|nr:HD domain-containing protein [Candidatus Peregrinibacteria bacterium]